MLGLVGGVWGMWVVFEGKRVCWALVGGIGRLVGGVGGMVSTLHHPTHPNTPKGTLDHLSFFIVQTFGGRKEMKSF